MPFAIRDFQPADFETLWRIDQACFAPGISYSRAELKFYIRRSASFTLVAVAGGQDPAPGTEEITGAGLPGSSSENVVGFIVAEAERGSGHIITIDVVASARRSGLGSLLLLAAESRLRAAQCKLIELETAVDNLSALSFYKRHGFHVVKTWPRYYSNGVDALVLQKELNP